MHPGEKLPVHGRGLEGQGSLNEAMTSGESKPVTKRPGDDVIGGSINGEGALRLEVAVAAFVFWFLVSGESLVFALTVAVTVLVIACPHALGLAIPVVTTISTSLAARVGMLNRNADVSRRGLGHFHGVGEDL